MSLVKVRKIGILSGALILVVLVGAFYAQPTHATSRLACTGSSNCFQGTFECTFSNSTNLFGSATIANAPELVTSDGKGAYVNGTANVYRVVVDQAAHIVLAPLTKANKKGTRSITFDLNNPVPGDIGVPLGTITDNDDLEIDAQWYTDSDNVIHSLTDMAVGDTEYASMMEFGVHVNGAYYVMQAGPLPAGHCYSAGTAVYGTGTTQGTIYRASSTEWVVDLPEGSIGRLFDLQDTAANAVNKGLYYISLHYVIS